MTSDIIQANTSVCAPDSLSSWFSQPGNLSPNQGEKCQKDTSIWQHAHSEPKLIVGRPRAATPVHRQVVVTHFTKAVQALKNVGLSTGAAAITYRHNIKTAT